MDLQELKQTWNEIGKRLEKSEVYNRRVLAETLKDRTTTQYERLRRGAWFNLMSTLFVAAVVVPILQMKGIYKHESTFYMLEVACLLGVLMIVYRRFILSRFNITSLPLEQMQNVVRYQRCYLYEAIMGTPIAVSVIFATLYIEGWTSIHGIYFVMLFLATGLITIYFGWKRHRQTMHEIKQNLQELREFE